MNEQQLEALKWAFHWHIMYKERYYNYITITDGGLSLDDYKRRRDEYLVAAGLPSSFIDAL